MSKYKNEKVILDKKMAGYLVLRGVPLHRSKRDLKSPNRRVFFFEQGEKLDEAIKDYQYHRDKLVDIMLNRRTDQK